jgi:phage terminase large subunit-like protein
MDGWAASVSYGLGATGAQEKILEYLPKECVASMAWQSKPNNILSKVILKNGRSITFKSYEQGREDFQAAGVGVVWCDEEPPKDVWQEIGLRQKAGQPLKRLLSMTPVMGMTWVYPDVYLNGSSDVFVVTAGWDDNEHLTVEQKRQMAIGLSEDEIVMRRDGSFVKRQGLVYKDFDQGRNTVPGDWEPELGRHSVYRAMDYGFAEDHPFVCLWIAVDTDGSAVVYDELYLRQSPMDRTTEAVIEKTSPFKARGSWGDSARPDWIDFMTRNGLPVQKAIKDKEIGISKVTSWLLPDPLTGIPRLKVSRRCEELIRQLESYSYPRKNREEDRGKREPEKKDDDGPDALRYFVVSYSSGLQRDAEAITYQAGDPVTGYGGRLVRSGEGSKSGYVPKRDQPYRLYGR